MRSAIAADIPLIIELERESPTAAHWSLGHYKALFSEAQRLRRAWVIESETTPAGFLIARRVVNEWEIENILVAPAARRRGLASQLMGTFLATARGERAEAVFLEVRDSNQPARALYEKLGFHKTGRRLGYYDNPREDALTYRLAL